MTLNEENVHSCKRHTVFRCTFCSWQSLCHFLAPWLTTMSLDFYYYCELLIHYFLYHVSCTYFSIQNITVHAHTVCTYQVISLDFKLHKAHHVINRFLISPITKCFRKSLICLMAFSTLILTLAIIHDGTVSCPLKQSSKRKLGIVRKHLFLVNKSLAMYPLSANILWPGCNRSNSTLCSTINLSLLLPEKPGETKVNIHR